jgi:phospholipase C
MALSDIQTFVIVMLENRSFDHMVGYLSLPGTGGAPPLDVDGLRADPAWNDAVANLDGKGTPIPPFRLDPLVQKIVDPVHDLPHIATQIATPPNSGPPAGMGGFIKSYLQSKPAPTDPKLVMGHYDAVGVPMYDFFAREFAICDHWYSALPSGTQPNRLMAMAGESRISDNAEFLLPDQPLVYDWLNQKKIPWCSYQWAGNPFFTLMWAWTGKIIGSLNSADNLGAFRRFNDPQAGFWQQWNDGAQIPSVVFIEPKYTDDVVSWAAANDDHPPTGIAKGQDLVRVIYQTLIANRAMWANTMMIVTYDEHGGFFDHASPLGIEDKEGGYPFKSTGVRVPAFVVSPHVARGQPFHGKLDHTSVLRLLADRFTPGKPYSPSVAARQKELAPLSDILIPPPVVVRTPAVPSDVHSMAFAGSAVAPVAPAGPDAPRETETAEAFHQLALKLARERPDLLTGPHGQAFAEYAADAKASAAAQMAVATPATARAKKPKVKRPAKSLPKAKAKKAKARKPARGRSKRKTRR